MIAAERAGEPFLAFRDADAELQLMELDGERVCIGRDAGNDLVLPWDVEVSRVHALLERLGGAGPWSTTTCRATGPSSTASGCAAAAA